VTESALGQIIWTDLTVADAPRLRDFYGSVTGWSYAPVEVEGYQDFNMVAPDGTAVAGICHARGVNAGLPAQWLIYVMVASLDHAVAATIAGGGEVVTGPVALSPTARYAVIQDPAGAYLALLEQATA
jgi:predicted enzyme related to lactoylglutathione lyase